MDAGEIIFLLIAILAANLPFFSERIFFIVHPPAGKKHLSWRLVELIVLYFIVGGAAWLLESRLGAPHSQRWEFYAVTACMFIVFAYPGFVVKYLWKLPRDGERR
ncbi:MAG: DUF2818 family protein [Burkholderiales bacterium]|nr:DUF2818 family protein [Burkholderiales bacterium]